MAETPTSKSQARALRLMSLSSDGTYMHAAATLSAAGLPGDGLPVGHTWRSAGKLSDAELVALLGPASASREPVKTTSAIRDEQAAAFRQRRHEFNERTLGYDRREDQEFYDNLSPREQPSRVQDEPVEA